MTTTTSSTPTTNLASLIVQRLSYDLGALEPRISRETMEYHYGKHLATYFANLNNLVADTPFARMNLVEIVLKADGAIFNNAAQAWNHEFFFEALSPTPKSAPTGTLETAIRRDFGDLQMFKEQFSKAALGLFGSGWAWLAMDSNGTLSITAQSNAGNPLRNNLTPLLTVDVWEHAYYIDYRNRRADFLAAVWECIDWKRVEERYNTK